MSECGESEQRKINRKFYWPIKFVAFKLWQERQLSHWAANAATLPFWHSKKGKWRTLNETRIEKQILCMFVVHRCHLRADARMEEMKRATTKKRHTHAHTETLFIRLISEELSPNYVWYTKEYIYI